MSTLLLGNIELAPDVAAVAQAVPALGMVINQALESHAAGAGTGDPTSDAGAVSEWRVTGHVVTQQAEVTDTPIQRIRIATRAELGLVTVVSNADSFTF